MQKQDMGHRPLGEAAVRAASRVLIPFLLLLYFVNYIDRINISFGALTMNGDLGLSASEFGVGASMFFVGYVLLEVPSNLLLVRFGARKWIARIMISWGIVSAGMVLVTGRNSFYAVRFLLGVAEAGFFPGIIFYLSQWFPAPYRARMVSLFMIAMPLSGLFGTPLSTFLLNRFEGVAGLQGWQWMFLLEAIPAVLLGFACLHVLADRPAEARFLSPDQRSWLQATMDEERAAAERVRHFSVWQSLTNGRVLLLGLILFLVSSALYGSIFWLPQLVKTFGLPNTAVGFVAAIPYVAAVPATVLWSRRSDRVRERIWHVAIPVFLAGAGFILAGLCLHRPVLATIALSVACAGIYASFPVFWTLPTAFLTGPGAAAAIALITTTGNISGIAAPALIGWSTDFTGGFAAAMSGLGAILITAGCLVLTLQISKRRRKAPPTVVEA